MPSPLGSRYALATRACALLFAACAPANQQRRATAPAPGASAVASVGAATAVAEMDAGVGTTVAAPTDASTDAAIATTASPATPRASGPLPNLTINGPRMRTSAQFEWRDFGPNSCDIRERCLTVPGRRRLLRFDSRRPTTAWATQSSGTRRRAIRGLSSPRATGIGTSSGTRGTRCATRAGPRWPAGTSSRSV